MSRRAGSTATSAAGNDVRARRDLVATFASAADITPLGSNCGLPLFGDSEIATLAVEWAAAIGVTTLRANGANEIESTRSLRSCESLQWNHVCACVRVCVHVCARRVCGVGRLELARARQISWNRKSYARSLARPVRSVSRSRSCKRSGLGEGVNLFAKLGLSRKWAVSFGFGNCKPVNQPRVGARVASAKASSTNGQKDWPD